MAHSHHHHHHRNRLPLNIFDKEVHVSHHRHRVRRHPAPVTYRWPIEERSVAGRTPEPSAAVQATAEVAAHNSAWSPWALDNAGHFYWSGRRTADGTLEYVFCDRDMQPLKEMAVYHSSSLKTSAMPTENSPLPPSLMSPASSPTKLDPLEPASPRSAPAGPVATTVIASDDTPVQPSSYLSLAHHDMTRDMYKASFKSPLEYRVNRWLQTSE